MIALPCRLSPILICVAFLAGAQTPTYRVRIAMNPNVRRSQQFLSDRQDMQIITIRNTNGSVVSSTTKASTRHQEIVQTTLRNMGANATFRLDWRRDEVEDAKGKRFDPMQGKTFTVSVRGDSVGMMSSDGQPLPERKRDMITHMMRALKQMEANNVCIPFEPIAVGAKWKITAQDAAVCAGALGRGVGSSESTGTLTAIDGDSATIDYRFSFKIANLGPLEIDEPEPFEGTMRVRVSLTEPLRWTTTTKGHVAVTAHPGGPQAPSLFTDVRFTDSTQSTPLR